MKPEAALDFQITKYRQMTGEQRLKLGLDLHEFACNLSREGIRHQFPKADEAEVERHLRERILLARELQVGPVLEKILDGTIKPKTT
jgi:hypothetical protein